MRIGLFCDRTLTYSAIDSLIRSAGVQDQKIIEFRYRSKKWKGWPGDVYIKDNGGKETFLPREARLAIKENFTPVRCRLCYDKLNTFADISVGDSYGIGESAEGISSIIIRNENIHKLILSAVKSDKIRLWDVDPYRIIIGQAIGERIKQFTLFSSAWEKMGYAAPVYSLNYSYTKAPGNIDLSSYENVLKASLKRHYIPARQFDSGGSVKT
jgi:coenzyme F420 hydrogenase subunit beta